jgi:hypothetical protein
MAAPVVFVLICALTVVNQYHDNTEKAEDKRKSEELNRNLQGQAKAANDAQKENTALFLKSFDALNQQVGDLKAQVKTEALQKELAAVQADLVATQKALAPGPKAVLAFSFWPFYNPAPPQSPSVAKQARFPTNDDGSYHVEFTVVNPTDVDAVDGEITLRICDACKFAKEPPGFSKLDGQSDTERNDPFVRILARSHIPTMTADILAPKNGNFVVGISYRCHTCVVSSEASLGTVLVSGSFVNQATNVRSPVRHQSTKPALNLSPK